MEINTKNVSLALGTVGALASAINPTIGGGLILAGKAVEKFNQIEDDMLENDFVGLSLMASELGVMLEKNEFDSQKISLIKESLESLSVAVNKFSKMIG